MHINNFEYLAYMSHLKWHRYYQKYYILKGKVVVGALGGLLSAVDVSRIKNERRKG